MRVCQDVRAVRDRKGCAIAARLGGIELLERSDSWRRSQPGVAGAGGEVHSLPVVSTRPVNMM